MFGVCGFDVTVNYVSDGFCFYGVLCRHVAFVKYLYLLVVLLECLHVGVFLVDGGVDGFLYVTVLVSVVDENLSQHF